MGPGPGTRNARPGTRDAVLLVGGQGERLRPLTDTVPKPLVLVANRPLIWYTIEMLRRGGVGEVALACGYKAGRLREGVERLGDLGVAIRFVEEEPPLDTAGAVRNGAEGYRETFIAMNGDQIMDVDVRAVVAAHRERGAVLTIVLRRVADISAFGLVRCDDQWRVLEFREKGAQDETGRNLINSGMYVFEPRVLDRIPAGVRYSNERQLFPELIVAGEPVYAVPISEGAYWVDVGTAQSYLAANAAILRGALPHVPALRAEEVDLSPQAELSGPVSLASACRIGPGARIGPDTSVGEGALIERDSVVRNSIVWPSARIGAGADLDGAIIGPHCHIPTGSTIRGPTIVV